MKKEIREEEEEILRCNFCGKEIKNDKGYCNVKCLEADFK